MYHVRYLTSDWADFVQKRAHPLYGSKVVYVDRTKPYDYSALEHSRGTYMVVGQDGDDGDHLMKKQFACVSCESCRPRADGSGCNFYDCKYLNWTGEFEDAHIGYGHVNLPH